MDNFIPFWRELAKLIIDAGIVTGTSDGWGVWNTRGPSRFDWDRDAQTWIYRRNKANLLRVLESELEQLCGEIIFLDSISHDEKRRSSAQGFRDKFWPLTIVTLLGIMGWRPWNMPHVCDKQRCKPGPITRFQITAFGKLNDEGYNNQVDDQQ
ncbi:hypothetical protein RJ639_025499 [Escallonia herrerae]|uniref:Uncharacterized protein n=1 Tax=Escallonia herrerae TaxID=1293975 RepID=A0AA88USB8_9ASTE|nr:hypothetical protein RJ639_025499 [Escallonia herrerae]